MSDAFWVKYSGPNKPIYQTSGAAGCDLISDIDVDIWPNATCIISTGLFLEIPTGFEGQIRSRSGLAAKHEIHVLNSPGTVDSDFRGEIKVILHNCGVRTFSVKKGDRIAQLVFSRVFQATFERADNLSGTVRGQGGFGSTGV